MVLLNCVSELALLIDIVVPFILHQRTTDPVYDKSVVDVTYLRFQWYVNISVESYVSATMLKMCANEQ